MNSKHHEDICHYFHNSVHCAIGIYHDFGEGICDMVSDDQTSWC